MADDVAPPAMAQCRAVLLAALALGIAGTPAQAARHGSGDGWRSVRLCKSESCWAKHSEGWRTVSPRRHGR